MVYLLGTRSPETILRSADGGRAPSTENRAPASSSTGTSM
jgi:hypothetical protein